MKRSRIGLVLVLGLAAVVTLRAQAPALTNADVTRLVAMRVSDLTVNAVIREAQTTQFDLNQRAVSDLMAARVSASVVAMMRQRTATASTLIGDAAASPANRPASPPPRYRTGATCRDGTGSNATGAGACSRHRGVSCWRYSDGTCTPG